MKIIFNNNIAMWYSQIYDELIRHYELILPENYKDASNKNAKIDLDALEKCVKENKDIDFIFDFPANFPYIIEWLEDRKINIPLIKFSENAINRPYIAKMSVFTKVWYVEKYAKPLMEYYKRENLMYKGMAANPYMFYPKNINKIYDIGFFGQFYGERGYWLNLIRKFCEKHNLIYKFPIGHGVDMPWSYEDINRFYNQTKINITFATKESVPFSNRRIVNLRTFEVSMSGGFQLMQYSPCLEEYFEIDKEIICWKKKKDLFQKILYYLENPIERDKIAKNGYRRAIEDHTWSKRFEEISTFLKKKDVSIDFTKYIRGIDRIVGKNTINRMKDFADDNLNQRDFAFILKYLGFNTKKDLKTKRSIKILCWKKRPFFYKPNLKNYYFIEIKGKIMMVIKLISSENNINLKEWNELEKIVYLTENIDLSIPNFGILTNGNKWVIRDFINRKWLKTIPNRRVLKSHLNLNKYSIMKIMRYLKTCYIKYNFAKIVYSLKIKYFINYLYYKTIKILVKPHHINF